MILCYIFNYKLNLCYFDLDFESFFKQTVVVYKTK